MFKLFKTKIPFEILQYTKESFFSVFPEATKDDYLQHLLGNHNELQMVQAFEKEQGHQVLRVRRVVIDQDYFTWLSHFQLPNTNESRIRYAREMSDADVILRWKKHERHVETGVLYIPLALVSKTPIPAHGCSLSDLVLQGLSLALELSGKVDTFTIFPQMLRMEDLNETFEHALCRVMDEHVKKGKTLSFVPIRKPVLQTKVTTDMRFIPIVFHKAHPAILRKKDLIALEHHSLSNFACNRLSALLSRETEKRILFKLAPFLCVEPKHLYLEFIHSISNLHNN